MGGVIIMGGAFRMGGGLPSVTPPLSIQFQPVYFYSPFYDRNCLTEAETQSQDPQLSTLARKNSLLTGRNLGQNQAYKEEPSC